MTTETRVHATLSGDALANVRVLGGTITEQLVETPRGRVTISSDALSLSDVVGSEVTLSLTREGAAIRTFPLRVWSATYVGGQRAKGGMTYQLELRHSLAWAVHSSSHRSFHDVTAQQMVVKVLAGSPKDVGTLAFELTRTLTPRAHEVQYGEPDLEFCWRLLEEEGVFLTTADDGTLTFRDAFAGKPFADESVLQVLRAAGGSGARSVRISHRLVPEAICLRDQLLARAGLDLTARATSSGAPRGELFTYPGGFTTQKEGEALAKVRLEEQIARSCRLTATTDRPALVPGTTFSLSESHLAARDRAYTILVVEHVLPTAGGVYANNVVAQPDTLPFRPPRVHRAPTLAGASTALITTKQEKVHVDAQANAHIRHYWDALAKDDDTASAWVPVLQPLVASGTFLARAGWDAAVRYLDGTISRPVVVGRLYLGRDAMPVSLPADKTVTSWATRTADGGAKRNGFRIDDHKDAELFTVEAGKDYDAVIEHDATETIVGADDLTVGARRVVVIDGTLTRTITGDSTLAVKIDAGLSVAVDVTEENGGARSIDVTGAVAAKISGNDAEKNQKKRAQTIDAHGIETTSGDYALTVHGDASATVDGPVGTYVDGAATEKGNASASRTTSKSLTINVGGDAALSYSGPAQEDVQGDLAVSSNATLSIEAGLATWSAGKNLQIKAKKVKIEGDTALTIIAGGGILSLTPAGVTIVGTLTAEASGNLEIVGAVHLVG